MQVPSQKKVDLTSESALEEEKETKADRNKKIEVKVKGADEAGSEMTKSTTFSGISGNSQQLASALMSLNLMAKPLNLYDAVRTLRRLPLFGNGRLAVDFEYPTA